jgi:O-antigen/teichoic acid export membrane protein
MKKGLIFNILFFALAFAPVVSVLADDQNPLTPILTRIVGVVYTVFGLFATVCFIYAGLMFAIAKGDAQKLEQAKAGLIWAVVGVGLGLVSASIMPILNTWLNPPAA